MTGPAGSEIRRWWFLPPALAGLLYADLYLVGVVPRGPVTQILLRPAVVVGMVSLLVGADSRTHTWRVPKVLIYWLAGVAGWFLLSKSHGWPTQPGLVLWQAPFVGWVCTALLGMTFTGARAVERLMRLFGRTRVSVRLDRWFALQPEQIQVVTIAGLFGVLILLGAPVVAVDDATPGAPLLLWAARVLDALGTGLLGAAAFALVQGAVRGARMPMGSSVRPPDGQG